MKKILLIIFALSAYVFSYAQCTDLFISEYVEGSSQNKAIEIYNPTDHEISLEGYVIKRYSNGSTKDPTELQLYQPDSGVTSIASHDVLVITNGQIIANDFGSVDPVLYNMADLHGTGDHSNSPMYFNGNDAMVLEKTNGDYVDIFGKVGEDPGEGWYNQASTNYITNDYWLAWTQGHTLVRKASVKQGVMQNPGSAADVPIYFMVNVEWDTVPGRFINDTTWSTADLWDSLGTHTCDCQTTGIENIVKPHEAFFFPNPVINKEFTVKATEIISDVEIVNVIGQTIFKEKNNALRGDMFVRLPECNEGLYLVKIRFKDNKSIVKKILVR